LVSGEAFKVTLEEAVSERIDNSKLGPKRIGIIVFCLFLAVLDGYDMASMGLALPLVAKDWNIAAGTFGPALAAMMVGVAIGSISLAWLGDRVGRKPVLIVSTFGIGLSTLATMAVHDLTWLTICRLLLGVCFGAGIPNMYSLMADIVPSRNRIFCMTLLTASASIGGIFGGLVAPIFSARYGWQGIFLPGGLIPLAMALLMFMVLLESPRVLAARGRLRELGVVLGRFGIDGTRLPEANAKKKTASAGPAALLRDGLWPVTLFYLIGWISTGFVYHLLVQWLPTLMTHSGWETGAAQRSVSVIYGGCLVGGLALSWLMDRWQRGGAFVPALAFGVGSVMLAGLSVWLDSPLIHLFLLGIGLAAGGAQIIQGAIAAYVFPLNLLTVAYGWLTAFSRIGAVGGPLLVGWMMLAGWSGMHILMVYAAIGMLGSLSFVIMALTVKRRAKASLQAHHNALRDPSLCQAGAK
jgi:AAHS family 4-hydroxybenzoate transporter-like MFS transporter